MRQLTYLFSLAVLLAFPTPAAAQGGPEKAVQTHRNRAAALAAKGKADPAFRELNSARALLKNAAAGETLRQRNLRSSTAFRKEIDALRASAAKESRKPDLTPQQRQANVRRFLQQEAAIYRKHGIPTPQQNAQRQRGLKSARAKYALIGAAIDEQEAAIRAARGQAAAAKQLRRQAALTRLQAYETLGQTANAETAAKKLLIVAPDDASVYDTVGRHYQGRKQFASAADVWRRGIRAIEAGKTRSYAARRPAGAQTGDRTRLPEFYRQLAFCLQKQGKAAEMRQALQQAERLARR